MLVDPVVNTTASAAVKPKADESMGKDAFLKLLVTQLQNQDPLNPTDNTEFVAQLAQFSSLEGITNLDKTMSGMSENIAAMENYSTAGLIGRDVKVDGSSFELSASAPAAIGYRLDSAAANVRVTISDQYGRPVRTLMPGPGSKGEQVLSWNGLDESGAAALPGVYSFTVRAVDEKNKTVDAEPFVIAPVKSIDFSSGDAGVVVGAMTVSKDEIKAVY